ncbi:MAG: DUF975 family protein [Sarcina sp.]
MRILKLKRDSLEILKDNWLNVIGASIIFFFIPFIILQGLNIKALGILSSISIFKPFSLEIIRDIVVIVVFVVQPYFILCFLKYNINLMNSKRRIPYLECIVHWRQYLRFLGIVMVDFMMISVVGFILLKLAELTGGSLVLSAIFVILFFIEVFVVFLFVFPAGFLIAQNHSISFEDALKASLNIVRRNFWRSVLLWLSFLGWIIVGIITVGIGFIWIAPYMASTMQLFVKSKNKGFAGGMYYSAW